MQPPGSILIDAIDPTAGPACVGACNPLTLPQTRLYASTSDPGASGTLTCSPRISLAPTRSWTAVYGKYRRLGQ